MKKRKLLSLGLAVTMAFSIAGCSDSKNDRNDIDEEEDVVTDIDEDEDVVEETEASESEQSSNNQDVEVGDIITLGNYGEGDITWIVLAEEGGNYLVISEYVIDARAYSEEDCINATWENSALRTWLNNEFYNVAFTPDEQDQIVATTVTAGPNSEFDTDPGSATMDKVFLLSIDEANTYFASDADRTAQPTDYAILNGLWINWNTGCWWLRSPGESQNQASYVTTEGIVHYSGLGVDTDYVGIRPVMWVSLE